MKHSQQKSARLVKALDYRHMVDVTLRGRDRDLVRGYVLGIGGKWILVHETTPGGAPDGTVAIRRSSIAHVARTKHFSALALEALKLPVPGLELGVQELDSTRGALRALGADGALLSVMRDVARPDSMVVGALVELDRKRAWLLEVTYRARWKNRMTGIKPRHISRIGSGGDYLERLALVAGPRPPRSLKGHRAPQGSPAAGAPAPAPDDSDR